MTSVTGSAESNTTQVNRANSIKNAGGVTERVFSPRPAGKRSESRRAGNSPFILVHGSVTDLSGQPIAGVVIKHDGMPTGVRTDAVGYYKIFVGRSDNSYPYLIFLKSGFKRKMVRVAESDPSSRGKLAADVTMAYSSETVTVNGWVGETNGTSIQGEVVKLISLTESLYYSALSDAAGNFRFEGIKRGVNYKVDIAPSENYKRIAAENLTITDHDIPLYISLEPINLVSIEGVIIDSNGGSVSNLKFNIRSDINSIYDSELISDDFGRFMLPDFPMGKLLFTTESPRYFKVTGIDLSQSSYTNLVVPVDIGPRQISGWVRNHNSQPLPGARAVLDAQFEFNGLDSSSIRTYVTDETGYFEFLNLGPGEHYLTVYAKGFINQGISYDTSVRVDQLYLQLSPWSDSLTNAESLN